MWGGHINNVSLTVNEQQAYDSHFNLNNYFDHTTVSDIIYKIWLNAITQHLQYSRDQIRNASVILILPEQMHRSEIKLLLNIVLNQIGFKQAFIQMEGVCAAFGMGFSSPVCVVDMGESKCSISVVEDGASKPQTRICLPYGGYHISKCLLWTLNQCNYPLKGKLKMNRMKDRITLQKLRNEYCQYITPKKIVIPNPAAAAATTSSTANAMAVVAPQQQQQAQQTVQPQQQQPATLPAETVIEDNSMDEEQYFAIEIPNNGKICKFEVGDPLLLAALAYFYPKLLYSATRQAVVQPSIVDGSSSSSSNSINISAEPNANDDQESSVISVHGPHEALLNECDIWSNESFEQLADMAAQLEEYYGRLHRQGYPIVAIAVAAIAAKKKKKKKSKKIVKDANEERIELLYTPLDRAVIKSIEKSAAEWSLTKKKTVKNIQILLVGGLSNLKGLASFLQHRVQAHFAARNTSPFYNVIVTTNERDAETSTRFSAWKGGQILTFLDPIKEMWVTQKEFATFGLKVVQEKSTYVI